jgi:hypothetical protein
VQEHAKAIDANFEEQFAGLAEDAGPSPAQIEGGVAGLIGILRGAATDVEALQGPAALEEKVDAFLDRFNAGTRSRRPTRSLEKSDWRSAPNAKDDDNQGRARCTHIHHGTAGPASPHLRRSFTMRVTEPHTEKGAGRVRAR